MKKIALTGQIVLPDEVLAGGVVVIDGEIISGVYYNDSHLPENDIEFRNYGENWITPGLVDVHIHGARGHDVMDADMEGLKSIALHQATCGVTGFFPTTLSSSLDSISNALEAVRQAAKLPLASAILGVHLEGPFLSANRRGRGSHDPKFIKPISREDLEALYTAASGFRTIITLASEVEDNLSFIPELARRGFIVSLGHTDATYEQGLRAIRAGVTHATHLFNAWREFHHRDPGGIGAVMDTDGVYAELIADGIHVHPSALRLAIAAKGKERICLVTDSLSVAGLGDGVYPWGDQEIVLKGNEVRLRDSGILAGSVLGLNRAVKNIIEWTGAEVWDVVNMASLNPARNLGLDERIGSIREGKQADFAVFDKDFQVVETWLRGKPVLDKKGDE